MIDDNIALITWTHNEYSDIWQLYFGRLEKHVKFKKSYVFLDNYSDKINEKHTQLINNDDQPFYKRFLHSISSVKEEYVVYSQEDHIFYSDCDYQKFDRCFTFLKNSSASNVRLIKSGELKGSEVDDCIFKIPQNSNYLFSQQSSIWKKQDLIKLVNFYKPRTYRDVELYGSIGMNNLNLETYYYYNNEPKRGSLHFDSSIFPYIATAVCKGKWNLKQYPVILKEALGEYSIDHTLRGVYEL